MREDFFGLHLNSRRVRSQGVEFQRSMGSTSISLPIIGLFRWLQKSTWKLETNALMQMSMQCPKICFWYCIGRRISFDVWPARHWDTGPALSQRSVLLSTLRRIVRRGSRRAAMTVSYSPGFPSCLGLRQWCNGTNPPQVYGE